MLTGEKVNINVFQHILKLSGKLNLFQKFEY